MVEGVQGQAAVLLRAFANLGSTDLLSQTLYPLQPLLYLHTHAQTGHIIQHDVELNTRLVGCTGLLKACLAEPPRTAAAAKVCC